MAAITKVFVDSGCSCGSECKCAGCKGEGNGECTCGK